MKYIKLFAILALATMTMNATAAVTAKAEIKIAGSVKYDKILLVEDDETAADFSDLNNAKKMMSTHDAGVNVWAVNGSEKLGSVAIPDLNGLVLKFKANSAMETSFEMTFSNLEGKALKLQKGAEIIEMTDPYNFTIAGGEEVTFTVISPASTYTRTLVAGQTWGTICLPNKILSVEGGVLYDLKEKNAAETEVYLAPVQYSEAGGAYFFEADADASEVVFTYDLADEVSVPVAGALVGTFEASALITAGNYGLLNNVLKASNGSATIGQYCAYVDLDLVDVVAAPAPGRRVMRVAATATALENAAEAGAACKMIENGRVVILKNGVKHNAIGQIVK